MAMPCCLQDKDMYKRRYFAMHSTFNCDYRFRVVTNGNKLIEKIGWGIEKGDVRPKRKGLAVWN